MQGAPCVGFVSLEEALDDTVGGQVALGVSRGGVRLERSVGVGDLHALTPYAYVEVRTKD